MKYFTPLLLILLYATMLHAQESNCSALFLGHSGRPYIFRDRLGRGDQFGRILKRYQCTSASDFVTVFKNPTTWTGRDERVLKAEINCILQGIGMPDGIEDLSNSSVALTYIPYGTVGNLGSWSKRTHKMKYLFVVLAPAGEPRKGIRAFKITGPGGKSVYICTTCGNAFYPKDRDCCHDTKIQYRTDSLHIECPAATREIPLKICYYKVCNKVSKLRRAAQQQEQGPRTKRRGIRSDTVFVNCVDTIIRISASKGNQYDIYSQAEDTVVHICDDQTIALSTKLYMTGLGGGIHEDAPIIYRIYTTCPDAVITRWEFVLGGGISNNSAPRYESNAVHTRTDRTHFAGELMVGYGISRNWQLGLVAAYQTVSYQDDNSYAGSIANTYNRITTGKLVPVQAFMKWSNSRQKDLQTDISLFCGYAIAFKDKIENGEGTLLSSKPGTSGGLTGGIRLSLTYFFNEHIGAGLAMTIQYTSVHNNLIDYKGWVVPATLTLHYRLH